MSQLGHDGRLKTKENFIILALKVVAVAYERWCLTGDSKYGDLTWKLLLFWKTGHLWEEVTTRGSTVITYDKNVFNTYLLTDGVKYALLSWSLHLEHSVNQPNMKILYMIDQWNRYVWYQKIPMPTQEGGLLEISRRRRVSKAKILKEK